MKLIRFLDPNGKTTFGTDFDGSSASTVVGSLEVGFKPTGERATVVKLLSPIQPTAILCIGLNYRKHAEEQNAPLPKHPVLFMKSPGAVQGHGGPIELPRRLASRTVDYECELAVVIGKQCKNATKQNALDYVFGYTCGNDVSGRDWQRNGGGGQWCRGKSFDTFAPLGPCIVTADEIPNPNALRIQTILSGEVMQDGNTDDMVFDVPTLIAFLSSSTTLLPGTVILTGTPEGVGFARKQPVFLKAGDVVTVKIDGIGELTNPVVEEQAEEGAFIL